MKAIKRPVNIHKAYHAHVYFDDTTKDYARKLCDEVGEKFNLNVGKFHEKLIGPHLRWSCQVSFGGNDFASFIPWLDENRKELTIFVHGVTGDDLKDHTEHTMWMGQVKKLNLEMFQSEG